MTQIHAALTQACGQIFEVHRKLADVHQHLGPGVFAGGDASDKPPLPFPDGHANDAVAA